MAKNHGGAKAPNRTIAVSYSHGHAAKCPNCKEYSISARDFSRGGRIREVAECAKCKEVFDIVVPEDPHRLQSDDKPCPTLEENRIRRQEYLRRHPDVIHMS